MGLAVAGGNVITLLFTIVFAHLLGASNYGSLATLISAFFIASIPGTALQAVVAREVSAAAASGRDGELVRQVHAWWGAAAATTVLLTFVSVLLRSPLANLLGVDRPWAAALVLPTAGLWVLVSLQRGLLQGTQSFRAVGVSVVGEALARLVLGLMLVGAGLQVTGAFGGQTAALVVVATALWRIVPARKSALEISPVSAVARPTLPTLLQRAGVPAIAMALLVLIQNLDVIVVKHVAPARTAGAYASASFSAKALVWIAIGLGMYLLPETSRRFHHREDTRRLFLATVSLMTMVALPSLVIFAVAGHPLLSIVFGKAFAQGANELLVLGLAMTALAFTYLSVQYLLALRQVRFLRLLVGAAIVEPVALATIGNHLIEFAATLLVLQLVLAVMLLTLALSRPTRLRRNCPYPVA